MLSSVRMAGDRVMRRKRVSQGPGTSSLEALSPSHLVRRQTSPDAAVDVRSASRATLTTNNLVVQLKPVGRTSEGQFPLQYISHPGTAPPEGRRCNSPSLTASSDSTQDSTDDTGGTPAAPTCKLARAEPIATPVKADNSHSSPSVPIVGVCGPGTAFAVRSPVTPQTASESSQEILVGAKTGMSPQVVKLSASSSTTASSGGAGAAASKPCTTPKVPPPQRSTLDTPPATSNTRPAVGVSAALPRKGLPSPPLRKADGALARPAAVVPPAVPPREPRTAPPVAEHAKHAPVVTASTLASPGDSPQPTPPTPQVPPLPPVCKPSAPASVGSVDVAEKKVRTRQGTRVIRIKLSAPSPNLNPCVAPAPLSVSTPSTADRRRSSRIDARRGQKRKSRDDSDDDEFVRPAPYQRRPRAGGVALSVAIPPSRRRGALVSGPRRRCVGGRSPKPQPQTATPATPKPVKRRRSSHQQPDMFVVTPTGLPKKYDKKVWQGDEILTLGFEEVDIQKLAREEEEELKVNPELTQDRSDVAYFTNHALSAQHDEDLYKRTMEKHKRKRQRSSRSLPDLSPLASPASSASNAPLAPSDMLPSVSHMARQLGRMETPRTLGSAVFPSMGADPNSRQDSLPLGDGEPAHSSNTAVPDPPTTGTLTIPADLQPALCFNYQRPRASKRARAFVMPSSLVRFADARKSSRGKRRSQHDTNPAAAAPQTPCPGGQPSGETTGVDPSGTVQITPAMMLHSPGKTAAGGSVSPAHSQQHKHGVVSTDPDSSQPTKRDHHVKVSREREAAGNASDASDGVAPMVVVKSTIN